MAGDGKVIPMAIISVAISPLSTSFADNGDMPPRKTVLFIF